MAKGQTKIWRAMRDAGLSQAAVARDIGVTWQMVHHVVRGTRTSARVRQAIERLIAERRQGNGTPPAA